MAAEMSHRSRSHRSRSLRGIRRAADAHEAVSSRASGASYFHVFVPDVGHVGLDPMELDFEDDAGMRAPVTPSELLDEPEPLAEPEPGSPLPMLPVEPRYARRSLVPGPESFLHGYAD